MKILLLSHAGSVTGGAEKCLLEYVDVLLGHGHKCKVMVPQKGDMTRTLTEKNIDWTVVGYGWAIQPHRRVHPHRILRSTGASLVRIFQEVEKYKPDLIITNTSVIPWGLYAGRTFNIPTMMLVHEILSDKDPSLNVVPSYEEYAEIINRNTDYIIYNSQFVKDEFAPLITLPKTSEHILYPLPALEAGKIDHLYKPNVIRGKLKVAIFGALSPRKNQLEAAKAAKLLKDQGFTDFTIDFYGDKEANVRYTKELRRFISTNGLSGQVKIKGYATDVYEKMNEYNVLISTATYEPFGRTTIEGQLFGRIVIANNTGGGPELVDDGQTGLLYELGSPEQLADKISWIIENEADALALGEAAKTKQLETFLTNERYRALTDGVEYIAAHATVATPQNIFDPLMSMFQYNHQLNHKYRYVYRIFHNRLTYQVKGLLMRIVAYAKRVARHLLP